MAARPLAEIVAEVARLTPLQVPDLGAVAAREVTAIAYDSRQVVPGAIFVALRGAQRDGATYAAQAVERGAIAIVADSPGEATAGVPWIVAGQGRVALAACVAVLAQGPREQRIVAALTQLRRSRRGRTLADQIDEALAALPA